LVFVAEHLRERAARASGPLASWVRRASIAPMGIDTARFAEPVARQPKRVVFLGRLVDIKGVDVLCRAMGELVGVSELVIAGDGPRREEVAAAAARVGAQYLGPVYGRARDQLLQSAAVVIIPSIESGQRCEGAPVTAFEAMAAGAAVVASRTGGLAELPADAVSWVQPGSSASLVAEVRRLVEQPEAVRAQRQAGYRVAAGRDWQAVGPGLMPAPRQI
jgi:glycosyltransferase involved in cell wall biosynthesis